MIQQERCAGTVDVDYFDRERRAGLALRAEAASCSSPGCRGDADVDPPYISREEVQGTTGQHRELRISQRPAAGRPISPQIHKPDPAH